MTYSGVSFQESTSRKVILPTEQAIKANGEEEYDEASTSTGSYSQDDYGCYDDDSSDSSWDEDMDDLMDWFNGTIVSPDSPKEYTRTASMPVIRVTTPKPIGSLGGKSTSSIILNRLQSCQSEYLQAPVLSDLQEPLAETSPESPEDCLREIFQSRGFDCSEVEVPEHLFLKVTQEHIEAHSLDITVAARKGDLLYLMDCLKEGKSLQCCNKHGESIVHIVCRRGLDIVLKFLVKRAGVKVMVRDDVGRTPLHDAAWTGSPNFELVKMLLEQVPQMIHVKDSRNHTPLSYVPRQQWGDWCVFLKENQDLVLEAVRS